jgi:hypothetical protein
VRAVGRRFPGARDARFRVYDDVAAGDEDAGIGQRRNRQERRRRVAAGVGHELRLANRVALALGEAIRDPLGHAARLGVPPLTLAGIAQPECSGQIDDTHTVLDEHRRELGRRRVGERKKHQIGVTRERLDVERRDRAVPDAAECGQRARRRRRGRRGRAGQPHARMAREDPHELLARVAGRAGDGDARDRSGVSPGRPFGGVIRRGHNMHQKE